MAHKIQLSTWRKAFLNARAHGMGIVRLVQMGRPRDEDIRITVLHREGRTYIVRATPLPF